MATKWPQKPPLGVMLDWSDPINRGLVGCWLLNEGAGTRASDMSGNGNPGTITGATWASGWFGPCLSFDGNTDYVSLALTPALSAITGDITVHLRFCPTVVGDDIYATYGYSWASSKGWSIFHSSSKMAFMLGNGTNRSLTYTDGNVTAGQWYDLVCVRSGTVVTLYLNGAAQSTPGSRDGAISYGTATPLLGWTTTTDPFNGLIDCLEVYNRALTPFEIARLYWEPFAGFQREPIELWTAATGGGPATGGILVHPGMTGGMCDLVGGIRA